ncbi:MAG: flagellar motor switch protein FliN, partial [Rhodocyclaceae bacterium]|nr:flagellar motor switch protein FliN [Rhodocyclaceae bacterium]
MSEEEHQISEDDWASAMNEQAVSETAPAAPTVQPAQIFEQLTGGSPKETPAGDFDMILDIPVSLNV